MDNKLTPDISTNVACTLVPIQGYHLLLPNQCIAEIFVGPEINSLGTSGSACIGDVNWLNRKLPIFNFNELNKSTSISFDKKQIVVAIQFPFENSEYGYFGFLANRIPQVVQANNQTMNRELNPDRTHDYALSYIRIKGKSAIIPDLNRIAGTIQNYNRKTA